MSDMCTDNTYTSYSSADEYFKSLRLEYQKGQESGYMLGCETFRDEAREICKRMAQCIIKYRNPELKQLDLKNIKDVMSEFGWQEIMGEFGDYSEESV